MKPLMSTEPDATVRNWTPDPDRPIQASKRWIVDELSVGGLADGKYELTWELGALVVDELIGAGPSSPWVP